MRIAHHAGIVTLRAICHQLSPLPSIVPSPVMVTFVGIRRAHQRLHAGQTELRHRRVVGVIGRAQQRGALIELERRCCS